MNITILLSFLVMKFTLVLMTLNEIQGCKKIIPRINKSLFSQLLAIDGGSQDGTIEYQRSEVDVIVNFRTPIDYKDDGNVLFPEDTIPVDSFSGLYRVTTLTNSFNNGQFTQRLKLLRRPNQPQDIKQSGTNDKTVKMTDANASQQSYTPYGPK